MSDEIHRLYRARNERMLGGVCGGLGQFFRIDPTFVRLGLVFLTLVWPTTLIVYLVLMLVVPEEPLGQAQENTDVNGLIPESIN